MMMFRVSGRAAGCAALLSALLCLASPVYAQHNTPGGSLGDNSGLNGSLSHEDLEKIGGDHKQSGDQGRRSHQ